MKGFLIFFTFCFFLVGIGYSIGIQHQKYKCVTVKAELLSCKMGDLNKRIKDVEQR